MVQDQGIQHFFNQLAPLWDKKCVYNAAHINRILSLADIKWGDRVIDVGCGTGVLTMPLLQCGVSEIYAVDISEKMIWQAREKYCFAKVAFVEADFLDTNRVDYDCVMVHNAYPHFLDKEALTHAIYRSLKPGGRFVIAHSDSRESINGCHDKLDTTISQWLQPVEIEAQQFAPIFDIDLMIDDDEIFLLSGTRKE